ncbi:Putative 115 kDa protein in type-1 retrotransposable element R1DM [Eumeta japonica]|uniref:115 kDa protein in type-1 retrotransposable element R1DM n=1 Tax=Eumeta variegata TaxID=151549 RepID=A0A4C1YV09_EUMVA|nr:Putative 115 kDa protein in type-1 retrotransposable element R1DM [Eumeta japonica]
MFEIRTGGRPGPGPFRGTRVYNTAKARWSEFLLAFDNAKQERGLTAEMVESVDSCDQLDGVVELYTECVRCACDAAIPPKRSTRKVKLPWWSPELEGLKKDANTKKTAHPKCSSPADATRGRGICESQGGLRTGSSGCADGQLEAVLFNPGQGEHVDGVYRVIRDTGEAGRTNLFPGDQVDTDGPHHAEIRRRTDGIGCPPEALDVLSGVDPPFTGAELKIALRAFNPKKAPGIDGFTSDICQAAILRDLGLFLAVANKCLRLGYFPRAWKVAAIKVIPKPGKDDYSRPKSYRPIGLLSVMGKTVERMLVCRIKWHIMPKLQTRQYGFMPQRGAEDSLYDLMTHIYNELSLKKIILMVSLDIEGAFDNAWWPAIRNQLLAHKCPEDDFEGLYTGLDSRSNLWNLVLTPYSKNSGTSAYTCRRSRTTWSLCFPDSRPQYWRRRLTGTGPCERLGRSEQVEVCTIQNKRDGAYQKLKFDVPTICMGHTTIALVDEIRLLGLTIDKRLTFVPHVSKACKKAANIYKGIARAAKATWGLSPEIVRTIYVAVIEPIVMYACAWAPAASSACENA